MLNFALIPGVDMATKKTPANVAASAPSAGGTFNIPVDAHCSVAGAAVHEDYDCMLNQTNIGENNNKFYVIQLLSKGGKFYAWTRWGRVGERSRRSRPSSRTRRRTTGTTGRASSPSPAATP
jgi:hypothetical protein